MPNAIRLAVDGVAREDWTNVVVNRGIEQLAGEFRFEYVERGPPRADLQIEAGQECTISIDGVDVITGYTDEPEISYDDRTSTIAIGGRGKTGDLVDSSAIYGTGKWRDSSIQTIAENLCDPFGVDIVIDPTAAEAAAVRFPRFAIQEGETVFAALSRLAALRGMLAVTTDGTDVVFARAGVRRCPTPIELGKNVLAGGRGGSSSGRFQIYTFKSQLAGTDTFFGPDASEPIFTVTDPGVDRYRPMVVIAEAQGNAADLERRAQWERNSRAGKARRLTHRVHGFNTAAGPWQPNEIVHVRDERLRVDDDLLIVAVTFEKSGRKVTSTIRTARPEAFDVLVPPGPRGARTPGKSWIEW